MCVARQRIQPGKAENQAMKKSRQRPRTKMPVFGSTDTEPIVGAAVGSDCRASLRVPRATM